MKEREMHPRAAQVIVALAFPLVLAPFLVAQDTAPVAVKELRVGDRVLRDTVWVDQRDRKLSTLDGKILEEKKTTKTTTTKLVETIIERAKGEPPAKLKRVYEIHEVRLGEKTLSSGLQGKTVIIEKKKDGKYRFALEDGAELGNGDAEPLEMEFNRGKYAPDAFSKAIRSNAAAKVGSSWKMTPKDIGEMPAFQIDFEKGEANATFLKAYEKTGRRFGVFEYRFDMPITGLNTAGGKTAPLPAGSRLRGQMTMDGCIDGSAADKSYELKHTIVITGTLRDKDEHGKPAVAEVSRNRACA